MARSLQQLIADGETRETLLGALDDLKAAEVFRSHENLAAILRDELLAELRVMQSQPAQMSLL